MILRIIAIIIWVVSILAFINSCIQQDYFNIFILGVWLIFVTELMFYGYNASILNAKDFIKSKKSEIERLKIEETCLKSDIYNLKRNKDKIIEIIKEKQNHSDYKDFIREREFYKKEEEKYFQIEQRKADLEKEIEELKQSKMEIVESLTNLDGFRGIKQLVANMVENKKIEKKRNKKTNSK